MKPTQKDARWPSTRPSPPRTPPRLFKRGLLPIAAALAGLGGAIIQAPARADDSSAPAPANGTNGSTTEAGNVLPGGVDAGQKLLLKASGLFGRGMFKPAADDYEQFLKNYPNHADAESARYALALCHYRLNEFAPAVEGIQQVLANAKFKDRDEALAVLGHSELQLGHLDKALAAFDELLAKYPKSKNAEVAALNRAQVLYLDKKYAPAAAAAESFLKSYPQSDQKPAALYFLALAQRSQGQDAAAATTLADLLKADPKGPYELDATLLLGQSLEAQNKLAEAAAQYEKMIAMAPAARAADGHFSLGVVLYKSGKYAQAAKELSDVVTNSPDSPYAKSAKLQLGLVQLAEGKTDQARQTLTAVAQDDPADASPAKYGIAQCDIVEKKFDAAKTLLDSLLAQTPPPANVVQIALDHAVVLMELKNYADAAQEFANFVTKHPTGAQATEATYREAFCLHKLEKYEQSHALCKQVVDSTGEFAAPARELDAENLFLLAQYPEAAKSFSALASSTSDPDRLRTFNFRLGQCAYYSGDYPKAIELLTPLDKDPKVADSPVLCRAIFLLGDALLQEKNYAEAASVLKRYLPIAKADKQEAQFKLGLAQLKSKDSASAAQNLTAAADGPADSPWTTRALFEAGQLAYKQTPPQLDLARTDLTKALAGNPPEELAAGATYLLGWIDFDSKKFPEAATRWADLVSQHPKNALAADAAFEQGVALREAGKQEPALSALKAYVDAYPTGEHVAQATQLMAACLSKLKRPEEARKLLATLADSKGAGDSVLYELAWSQRDTHDLPGAEQTYGRLIKDHPDSKLAPAARAELAELLYDDKKYADAADLLETVVKDPSALGATAKIVNPAEYRLGWCYVKLDKPKEAGAAFDAVAAAAAKSPDSGITAEQQASALLQAGVSDAGQDKYDGAEKAFTTLLSKFPDDPQAPDAMRRLGQVQADAGQFDASLRTYKELLSRFPKDPLAYRAEFGAGWALENLKQYPEARAAYARAIALTNGETAARAQFQTGESFLEEGKFEQAIPALFAVEDVYLYPKWSARALFEAGRVFEELKQPDKARQQYKQVIAKYKDSPEAQLAADRLKAIAQ